ncbi:TIR domain-containing adapter molecule 2 [Bombina bombina]|uniref:TIR domain-containing adapter molecule 2 n=1 Tax=Bombina bombina TaxID=8345 RepID=UPI00235ACD4D|nr:TIR domain-containing adapter molecule 2 [Bombina bombina]XP_053557544.1 TIR domain-containing adapter molecule 2 [Bombina bombina]XP_053557546.1 TIR domain-containing adapter molecule 2 [Bombina bombina]
MMGICHSRKDCRNPPCPEKQTGKSQQYHSSIPGNKAEEKESEIHMEPNYGASETDVFYKFVILHANTDILEALRFKDMLQDTFHIQPGIIFAELPAGQSIMKTLEDAVNSSAWTIILLTENFVRERWCEFQFHATLINSINKLHKYNSVIPLRPGKNYLPREKTPFILKLINALEETNPTFAQHVEKTFQESQYQKQFAIWKDEKAALNLNGQN